LKADRAARLEAELVVDRWNRRLATGRDMLWSPTIRRNDRRDTMARRLLSGLRDEPGDQSADRGPSPAGLGGHDGARPTVFVVPRILVVMVNFFANGFLEPAR
jgi:hypothetical protein